MSNVMAAEERPSIRWTAFAFEPVLTVRLAAVCRRSWRIAESGKVGSKDRATLRARIDQPLRGIRGRKKVVPNTQRPRVRSSSGRLPEVDFAAVAP